MAWGDSWGYVETPVEPPGGASGLGRSRFTPSSEYEFERLYKRVKKSLTEAFKSQPLTADEQAAIELSLRGYVSDSGPRTEDETRRFVEAAIQGVQRSDLERRAASQQFAEDQLDAIDQLRRDNRRRAIILIILLMLL
ncbi:hypothetical protein [Caudoviricetes sp.]|nr:hypothetical protein [Caudoviricetes sp.]